MLIEFLCMPGYTVGKVSGSDKCAVAEVIPRNSGQHYTIIEKDGQQHHLPAKAFQRLYKIIVVGSKAKYYRFVDAPAEQAELDGQDRAEFNEKAVMTLEDLRSLGEDEQEALEQDENDVSGYDLINDEEDTDGVEDLD